MVPDGTLDFSDGIGTGGYMLERFEPGVNSRVKRNPNYWKAGRAHFDAVEMIAIKDTTARTNALISGQIDAFNFVELKTVHLLERRSQFQTALVLSQSQPPGNPYQPAVRGQVCRRSIRLQRSVERI